MGETVKQSDNRTFRRIVGLLSTMPLPSIGYAFPWASVLALFLIPVRTVRGWPYRTKLLMGLALLGIGMLVASAMVQRVEVSNTNVFSFAAFTLMVLAGVKLTDGVASAAHLLMWGSLGSILFYLVVRTENTSDTFEHLWKYGIAVPVGFAVVWFAVSRKNPRALPVLVLTGIAALSIFLGFRSHGLVCLVVVLLIFVKGKSRSKGRGFFKVVIAAALFWVLAVVLPAAIDAGLFGEVVRQRTMDQASSGTSALLAGRVEPPLSIAAVLARPIFGWGSLQALDQETLSQAREFARSMGLTNPATYMNLWVRSDGRVSVHSVLFEAWVQGGILAALMPLALIVLFGMGVVNATGKWAPFVILISVQGIWDTLFSTWGIGRPATLAISAVVVAWCITTAREERPKPTPPDTTYRTAIARASSHQKVPSYRKVTASRQNAAVE